MVSSARKPLGVRFWAYVLGGVTFGFLLALVAHGSVPSPTYTAFATIRLAIESSDTDDEASYDAYEAVRELEVAPSTQSLLRQDSAKEFVQLFSYRSEPVGPSAYMRITVESDRPSASAPIANKIAEDISDTNSGVSITQLARSSTSFSPPLLVWLFVGSFLGGFFVFAGALALRSRRRKI